MTDRPLARSRTVRRGEVELAVFEGGNPEGPTIVLIHGWPDTHRVWDGVAAILAPDFRLVAYDTRGQGDSVTGAPDAAFTLDQLGDDLIAVVDAVSPRAPVHLVGHDWGSIQAWEAVCRPGAERRVASFCSMSGPNLAHVSDWVRRRLTRPTPRGLVELAAQAAASSYVPFLVSPLAPPLLGALGRRTAVSGLRYYRANLGVSRPRAGEQRTSVPVLQLALTRDPAVRPATLAASDPFAEALERRELPYGHWVPRTHPQVVADEIRRFVREQDPGS
jgi:pimeloyl-ACP methyl ester carboxylesterase